jgi:hypothetical protein
MSILFYLFIYKTSYTLHVLLHIQLNLNKTRYFVLIVFIEELLNITYFLFFLLVCTRINRKVRNVRSMDFPNLVQTLVAIVLVLC